VFKKHEVFNNYEGDFKHVRIIYSNLKKNLNNFFKTSRLFNTQ
jgi:hypothetical protein